MRFIFIEAQLSYVLFIALTEILCIFLSLEGEGKVY